MGIAIVIVIIISIALIIAKIKERIIVIIAVKIALFHLGLCTRQSKQSHLGYSAVVTESPNTAQDLRFAYLIQKQLRCALTVDSETDAGY